VAIKDDCAHLLRAGPVACSTSDWPALIYMLEQGRCIRSAARVRHPVEVQRRSDVQGRLEAFSDGVIAIIITIMVLELKVPHGDGLEELVPLLPIFLSYVLSFVYVGIYWNNHHHMLHACTVSGAPICGAIEAGKIGIRFGKWLTAEQAQDQMCV
jgi:transmembrane protein TMEM174 (potassium channel)